MFNFLTVSTEYWHVTDKQTDEQTSCHGIIRAMHTRCVVKTVPAQMKSDTVMLKFDSSLKSGPARTSDLNTISTRPKTRPAGQG